jgi:hypothetical protein
MCTFNPKEVVAAFYPPFSGLTGTAPLLLTRAFVTLLAGEKVMHHSVRVLVALM